MYHQNWLRRLSGDTLALIYEQVVNLSWDLSMPCWAIDTVQFDTVRFVYIGKKLCAFYFDEIDHKTHFFDLSGDNFVYMGTCETIPQDIKEMARSPDGEYVALITSRDNLHIFRCPDDDPQKWRLNEKRPEAKDTETITCFAFTSDGKFIVTGDNKGKVGIVEVKEGLVKIEKVANNGCLIQCVACSPCGSFFASSSDFSRVEVYSMSSKNILQTFVMPERVSVMRMAFCPDNDHIALLSSVGYMGTWSLNNKKIAWTISCDGEHVNDFAYTSDGLHIATASGQGVKLWNVETKTLLKTFRERVDRITFTCDDRCIVGIGFDRYTWRWDVWNYTRNMEEVRSLLFHGT